MNSKDLNELLSYVSQYKNQPPDEVIGLLMKVVGLIALAQKSNPKVLQRLLNEVDSIRELLN